jgi:NAD(P)-dependent dehydrogenase (short-subunit alcohol dehydrogenase family)/acyl carrier protein
VPAPHAELIAPAADGDVYGQFQETMRRFLETQQRVFESYYSSGPVPAAPLPAPLAPAVQTEVTPEPRVAVPEAPVQQAPAAATVPQPVATVSLADRLIEIASERTGYPAEMLNLDANLEADLGIDSIKRVEIIAAFRRTALPSLAEPPAWFMERMTAARTLRTILDGVAELAGGPSTAAPVAAPPAAAPAIEANLKELLLQVASERTGYPAEMLNLDANLEADLGIDSIKRVEIIGAFRRAALPALAEPPASFMEEMTAARTLRAILEGVERLRGGAETRPAAPAAKPTARKEESAAPVPETAPRCVGAVVEVPLAAEAAVAVPAGVVILTDEGRGIAAAVAREVESRGGRACLLGLADLATPEAAAQAVARLRQAHGAIGGVLHLLPMRDAPRFPGLDEAEWSRYADPELKGLLYLLQAIAPELRAAKDRPVRVLSVSLGGGDFGDSGEMEAAHPWRGGLAGMMKTAAKEWEHARFRALDVDEIPEAAQLLREFAAEGPAEVGYRWGRRLTVQPMREEMPAAVPATPAVALAPESVVLVTGGAQGITAEAVREIAARTRATFVLLGRSPAPPAEEEAATAHLEDGVELRQRVLEAMRRAGESPTPKTIAARTQALLKARAMRRALADLRATGARVEYVACDVRDAGALAAVVADVRRRHGGIDALVHGAGVIEDRLILDKDPASFDRVVQTKVHPLLTLSRLLEPERLKLVMLFSSVSGFFGNPGQVDYSAANEVLNRMARRLKNVWPGKVVALNWGPWDGAGMVTPEVARQFAERGVPLVTVPAGRHAIAHELLHPAGRDVRVLVGPGPWVVEADRLAADLATAPVHTPLLAGQTVRRLPGAVIEARVVLDPARQAFLQDHRIDGKPVLPLTVALELMAEAAAAARPEWHVAQVRDLRLFCGVVLEQERREIALRAEPLEQGPDGGEWRVRITDPRQPVRPLYEALVRLEARMPAAPPAPPLEPIDPAMQLDPPLAYQRWLFHGPAFQVIEQGQGFGTDGIDVTVRGGARGRHNWLIDPLVLDAAPQLALLWSRAMYATSALPNRIGTYHRYGPIGTGPVQTLFRIVPGSDAHAIRATIWFVRDGRVVGQMEGLESTANAQLNRIGGGPRR